MEQYELNGPAISIFILVISCDGEGWHYHVSFCATCTFASINISDKDKPPVP